MVPVLNAIGTDVACVGVSAVLGEQLVNGHLIERLCLTTH